MRILILQLRRIGDVLMTTPAIRALDKAVPGAEIHVLVEPDGAAVVRGNPHVDRAVVVDPREWVRTLRTLRAERYDVVVDTLGSAGSARLAFLTGARVRIGRDRGWRRFLYTHRVPQPAGERYSALGKLALLGPLGVDSTDCRIEMFPAREEHEEAGRFWERVAVPSGRQAVAFAPVSRRPAKRWPAGRFAEVCDRWSERAGVLFVPLFGPGEEPMIEQVVARLRRPEAVAGACPVLSFGALVPAMQRCAFYFGNDNGIRHAAIAAGIPTAAVFGGPSPVSWTPPGSRQDLHVGGRCAIASVTVEEVDAMLARITSLGRSR